MDEDIQSIHEFDLNLIVEYYALVERQGPGSPDATRKALSFIEGLSEDSLIADLGCGSGGQTMTLAQSAPGMVTGVDLFDTFIDLFNENSAKHGLQDRVNGITGSMDSLTFEKESLDLIWSEGAIYNIGFEKGLAYWRQFLKPGGYVAVSEISWFTDERPKEIEDFWNDAYPEIDSIPAKMARMQKTGYVPVASFILPETCWLDHFYAPQVTAEELFLKKHKGEDAAEGFIANQRHEEKLYHKYKDCYGYVFYIGRKI